MCRVLMGALEETIEIDTECGTRAKQTRTEHATRRAQKEIIMKPETVRNINMDNITQPHTQQYHREDSMCE